ncbi:MAG: DUF6677 family protein [Planctomycetota bacterium]
MPHKPPNEEQPQPTPAPKHQGSPVSATLLPATAALVAFLIPGLGYLLFNDRPRTLRVALPIHALIILGLFIGGVSVVDSKRERWWFILQAPAGAPVFLVNTIHQHVLKGTDFGRSRLPRRNEKINTDHEDERIIEWVGDQNAAGRLQGVDAFAKPREIGSLCIAIAGMLNAIVIVDCLSGGKNRSLARRRRSLREGVSG